MDDVRLGMVVRARRHARGWRLADLAASAHVGATVCSMLERGQVSKLSVHTTRAIAEALGLNLGWDLGWQRQEVDRLLDQDHSALAARWARALESMGWLVRSEVSFNRYGDRGRVDLLAYHPVHRVVLVIELKTVMVDAQALLGSVDVKVRVAPWVARDLGWQPQLVVPMIVIAEGTTPRRHVAALEPLFGRFALRGHAAAAWLRNPIGSPSGILVFTKLPSNDGVDVRRAGRRRIRPARRGARSDLASEESPARPTTA